MQTKAPTHTGKATSRRRTKGVIDSMEALPVRDGKYRGRRDPKSDPDAEGPCEERVRLHFTPLACLHRDTLGR